MDATCPPLPDVLEIIQDLTIGQRTSESTENLANFLQRNIFPRFSPLRLELYLPAPDASRLLPSGLVDNTPSPDQKPTLPVSLHSGMLVASDDGPVTTIFHRKGDNLPPELKDCDFESHLLFPITDEADLSGILYLASPATCKAPREFIATMETLAAVIGSRLRSLKTIQQLKDSMLALEQSEKVRSALFEISEKTHTADNIDSLYHILHQTVAELLFAGNFYIATVVSQNGKRFITFPYFVDEKDPHFQGMRMELATDYQSLTGYLVANRCPVLLTPDNFDTFCKTNRVRCVGTKPHSWLGAPFYTEQLAGAVAVQSYKDIVYTERDKKLIAFVARHIGEALNRKQSLDELTRAKERAELAEQKKSNFLANMSHEIRTPMNGILGLTDLVLKSEISGLQRTYLEMVHSSADRLLKLINDILDFSKIEAGKLELEETSFNLRQEIANAIEILAISAAKKNIGLTVDCDPSIPEQLEGDADKLGQVLINLVGNGIKFTEEGGVHVQVRMSPRSSESDQVHLHFAVQDTGIGIPEENIDQVFEAFSQLGTTRDSNNPGTGLGLVIAAELVNLMGGKICVESTPGKGTTFFFSVTFKQPTATQDPCDPSLQNCEQDRIADLLPESLSILLVEDEYINRTLAIELLQREGWTVTCAENGRQALELLEKNRFDVVLMDVQMPELDGYATTDIIRKQERESDRHKPIIAMTAYAVVGDREKCIAAGMDGYISKPIDRDRIRAEIASVLSSLKANQ